jgi:hypothetical protein
VKTVHALDRAVTVIGPENFSYELFLNIAWTRTYTKWFTALLNDWYYSLARFILRCFQCLDSTRQMVEWLLNWKEVGRK